MDFSEDKVVSSDGIFDFIKTFDARVLKFLDLGDQLSIGRLGSKRKSINSQAYEKNWNKMPEYESSDDYDILLDEEERMEIVADRFRRIFQLEPRAPAFPAEHYVSELDRYVKLSENDNSDGVEQGAVLSNVLRKLKTDLKVSFLNFVTTFVSSEQRGLEILFQTLNLIHDEQGSNSTAGNRKLQKKNLTDEHDCLLCLKFSARVEEGIEKMVEIPGGLEEITTCLMSSFSKSRTVALEILTLACTASNGNTRILEAFTVFKFKFGESVRFKILVGMMNNPGYTVISFQVSWYYTRITLTIVMVRWFYEMLWYYGFNSYIRFGKSFIGGDLYQQALPLTSGWQIAALQLLNRLLDSCPSPNMRVYLQQELENAGFNVQQLQNNCTNCEEPADKVQAATLNAEITKWKTGYLDVEVIVDKLLKINGDNGAMKKKIETLNASLQTLEQERLALFKTEKQLKDECLDLKHQLQELQEQVNLSKETGQGNVNSKHMSDKMNLQKQSAMVSSGSSSSRVSSNRGNVEMISNRRSPNSQSLSSGSTASTHQMSSPSYSPGTVPRSGTFSPASSHPSSPQQSSIRSSPQMAVSVNGQKFNQMNTSQISDRQVNSTDNRPLKLVINKESFGSYLPSYHDNDPYAPHVPSQKGSNGFFGNKNGYQKLVDTRRPSNRYEHDAGPYIPIHDEPPTFIPAPDYQKTLVEDEIRVIENAFEGIENRNLAFF